MLTSTPLIYISFLAWRDVIIRKLAAVEGDKQQRQMQGFELEHPGTSPRFVSKLRLSLIIVRKFSTSDKICQQPSQIIASCLSLKSLPI